MKTRSCRSDYVITREQNFNLGVVVNKEQVCSIQQMSSHLIMASIMGYDSTGQVIRVVLSTLKASDANTHNPSGVLYRCAKPH